MGRRHRSPRDRGLAVPRDPPPARQAPRELIQRVGEAAATTVVGASLGGLAWSLIGLAWPGAVVAGLNGLVCGLRRTYDWRTPRGPAALVLDSTWAAPMTAVALVAHGVALCTSGRGHYVRTLSERHSRHVYGGGLRVRPGFLITLGNTINGAGGAEIAQSLRRKHLIDVHEDLHVWQARWWGPLYPVLYVGWMAVMAPVGVVVWLTRRPRRAPLFKVTETFAYYMNPFEWWAYSREGNWPPAGMVPGLGWRRPIIPPRAAPPAAHG